MTARPPLEQIEASAKRVSEAGYDHDDVLHVRWLLTVLLLTCERVQQIAERCQDPDLRAALLHPQWGVPAYLADAAGDVAQFFTTWDDRRADRAQEAKDNRAADAADARIAL